MSANLDAVWQNRLLKATQGCDIFCSTPKGPILASLVRALARRKRMSPLTRFAPRFGPIVKWHYGPMDIGQVRARTRMKCSLYILKCANGRYYVGSAVQLTRRLEEHNAGKTKSLKNVLPVELAFCQEFDDESTARKIEYQLKQKKSRKIIERIIQERKIKFMGP